VLGILLVDKPAGITSHDVVNQVRRRFGTRRVGHAGTLDPMATGLLVVAVGAATRFLQYLPLEPKEYEGEITFGRASTTYDAEGELSKPQPVPENLQEVLDGLIPQYTGLIRQLPPAFSAVKVAGKPLYAYARKGQDAPRDPRTVHVEKIELNVVAPSVVKIKVICSGGTYVRTLADDLGWDAGCGAHLSALRRTRAGAFSLDGSVGLEEASADRLMPLAKALEPMPLLTLNPVEAAAIRQGRRVGILRPPAGRLAGLLEASGQLIGVARVEGQELQPECVLPLEAQGG
jgi:tRNA pseudouridine55 synthase